MVGLPEALVVVVDFGPPVFLVPRPVEGGVGSAPVARPGVDFGVPVFGGTMMSVLNTQRWASLSCVMQFQVLKQASVLGHLPR